MNTHELNNAREFDPYLIREITRGYSDMDREKDDPMFEAYKRGYNLLYDDLQKTEEKESTVCFHMVVEKAGSNLLHLHQRTACTCDLICNFSNNFLATIHDEAMKLKPSEARDFLMFVIDVWKNALQNNRLFEGIELIRAHYRFIQLNLPQNLKLKVFGDIRSLVFEGLEKIEEKIVSAAEKHKVFQGLSNAHSFALTKGHLIQLDEFLDTVSNLSSGLKWYGPYDKIISDLFVHGHNIDVACKIRFITLTEEKGKCSNMALDLIHDELSKLGVDPEKYLPEEAKNMQDRCNRYKKSRMEELKQITRNSSR